MFFDKRFSETNLSNPDFVALAAAYGIKGRRVESRDELDGAIEEMLQHEGSYLLEAVVAKEEMVFPMTPTGKSVNYVMLNRDEIYKL